MTSIILHTAWLAIAALFWIVAVIAWRKDIYKDVFHPKKFESIDDITNYAECLLVLGPGFPS